ncbi:hypothetical protein MAR_023290 [Mya arenaria]|uniref:Chromo domain-containing protein n=1 Tax=Mya arenaria TaxID=6604 RepID=A0ABY7DML2_MYAAR|nr:hypothetical protein MAR_023290 [Mya arenaria]
MEKTNIMQRIWQENICNHIKKKNFFDRYPTLLETYWFPLMTNSTLREIVQQVNEFRSKGISLTSAVKRVLKKKKIAFEDLFDLEDSEESEEDENEEEYMDSQDTFKIDKIEKTKGIGKYKQYFVKWKYYPKKFNSWIKASDFE